MRSLFRYAFTALRSQSQKRVGSQSLFLTRSARLNAAKKIVSASFRSNALRSFQLSPIQQRFYSSANDNKTVDPQITADLIDRAFAEVDINPKQALQMFNELHETIGNDERVLYGKASALCRLDRDSEALEMLDQLSAAYPNSPVSSLKATIHFRQGNFELAAANYEDAAERFPDDFNILAQLAESYTRSGRVMDALETYEKANEINPNDSLIINNMGLCYQRLGPQYVNEVLSLAQQAVELHPENAELWNNLAQAYESIGELEAAQEFYDKMQSIDANLPLGSYNHASLLLRLNKLDEAEKMFLKLTELKEDNFNLRAGAVLISMYSVQKRNDEAIELAKKLLKFHPFQAVVLYYLGRAYMTSNIDEAIKHLEHALSIDSEHEHVLDALASCYFIKGQYDKAVEYFKRTNTFADSLGWNQMFDEADAVIEFLLKKVPERHRAIYKAKMSLSARKRDYAEEFKCFKKLLEVATDPVDYANFLLLNNDFEGALKTLDQILVADPERKDAVVNKAIVLIEYGRIKEAVELLNPKDPSKDYFGVDYAEVLAAGLSRDDNSLDWAEEVCYVIRSRYAANMAMSEVHRRRGNYEQAMKSWRTALAINNSRSDYVFPEAFPYRFLEMQQRAKILESMGDLEGAMKEYASVLAINPLDLVSKERLEALKSKSS